MVAHLGRAQRSKARVEEDLKEKELDLQKCQERIAALEARVADLEGDDLLPVSYQPGVIGRFASLLQERRSRQDAESPKAKRLRIEKTKKLAAEHGLDMSDPIRGPLPPGPVTSTSRSSRPVEPTIGPKKLAAARK